MGGARQAWARAKRKVEKMKRKSEVVVRKLFINSGYMLIISNWDYVVYWAQVG